MANPTAALNLLRRRLGVVLVLRNVMLYGANLAFAIGTLTLLLRFLLPSQAGFIPLSVAVALIAVCVATVRALRAIPGRDVLLALLDARAGAGGLVMASATTPLGAWQSDVPANAIPRIRWRWRRSAALFAGAILFLTGAVLAPARRDAGADRRMQIGQNVEKLRDQVSLLQEEQVLPEERADAIRDELKRLENESAGDDPARAWEALDSIEQAAAQLGEEAGESAVKRAEVLVRTEMLAFAASDAGLDEASATETMKELAGEIERAGQERSMLQNDLSKATQKAIADNTLQASQAREIANAARQGREQLRATLNKLRAAGLIDPRTLKQFEDAARFADRDALARYLRENRGRSVKEQVGRFCTGRGGVERGRGDAPLFFGEEARNGDARFKEQTLPPADAASLAESEIAAVSSGAPDASEARRSAGGALDGAATGGGSAIKQTLAPRHRTAVRRFFNREK